MSFLSSEKKLYRHFIYYIAAYKGKYHKKIGSTMLLNGNSFAMWNAWLKKHRGSKIETRVDRVVGATDYNKVNVVMG